MCSAFMIPLMTHHDYWKGRYHIAFFTIGINVYTLIDHSTAYFYVFKPMVYTVLTMWGDSVLVFAWIEVLVSYPSWVPRADLES